MMFPKVGLLKKAGTEQLPRHVCLAHFHGKGFSNIHAQRDHGKHGLCVSSPFSVSFFRDAAVIKKI